MPSAEDPLIDFQTLYERHAEVVYRFALYLSGDAMSAEDIVSETFIRVWDARERVELTTVRSYLLAIARNVFLHGWRGERRLVDVPDSLPDPRPDAQERIERESELSAALAALQELPEIDRAAVLLRAQEVPYAEISTMLGLPVVAVRVRVHRARTRLARIAGSKSAEWTDGGVKRNADH
ncbi:MAG: RNA polymerase sigma factor [Candidatus Eisenbacteria bacterium]